jgi:NAD(P)-dependent dehydrogenase (short-subunit alcohol dehydrogenase family)
MTAAHDKVWLITGVSSGLGRALATRVLASGGRVAGTLRTPAQMAAFEAQAPDRALAVAMDITDRDQVEAGVAQTIEHFGRIDVVANNAGYGLVAAIEETSEAEAQAIFDANFFGGWRVTQATLPHLRAQRRGHILNFSAMGGFHGVPGLGIYGAAKAATDLYSEALAQEVAPFGIKVTVLVLGVFRTDFADRSLRFGTQPLADYDATPAGQFRERIRNLPGRQPNDPDKAADAILQIVAAENPPLHAVLGTDAIRAVRRKLAGVESDIAAWEEVGGATAY